MKSHRLNSLVGPVKKQAGLTLVELMISIVLGLLIALAALGLLISSKSGYVQQDESARLQDTGRFALDTIARTARQGGYQNWEGANDPTKMPRYNPVVAKANMTANIAGVDANSTNASGSEMTPLLGTSVNGSDILALRFFGSGDPGAADGTMLDCVGFARSLPTSQTQAEQARGWSIFYVALSDPADPNSEPELRCKYQSDKNPGTWKSEPIARGVESFQVLYGLDTDSKFLPAPAAPLSANPEARIPNIFVTATTLNEMDAAIDPTKLNEETNWKRVVALKVALLIRGTEANRTDTLNKPYYLFEDFYDGKANPAKPDIGAVIKENELPAAIRNRTRKVVKATIQFRNQVEGLNEATDKTPRGGVN